MDVTKLWSPFLDLYKDPDKVTKEVTKPISSLSLGGRFAEDISNICILK